MTADTPAEGEELLGVATGDGSSAETLVPPFGPAGAARRRLARDRYTGAAVLRVSGRA